MTTPVEKSPVILVSGTFGLGDPEEMENDFYRGNIDKLPWWHSESMFARAARAHGLEIAHESFVWCTSLDGLLGMNDKWYAAGAALRYFAGYRHSGKLVSVIAHSHGGQVAAYAAGRFGLEIDLLVTLGMSVRRDMQRIRRAAQDGCRRWNNVWSPNDPIQLEGARGDGGPILSWLRALPESKVRNIEEPTEEPGAHSKLHDPNLWTIMGWWEWFQPQKFGTLDIQAGG